MFQQHDLVMVADEAEAGVSGGAGLAPADQKGAGRLLQCLDPLADGGIRGVDILLLEKSSGVLGEKKIAILNHGRDRICGAISGS